jgi:hypothetical protein
VGVLKFGGLDTDSKCRTLGFNVYASSEAVTRPWGLYGLQNFLSHHLGYQVIYSINSRERIELRRIRTQAAGRNEEIIF